MKSERLFRCIDCNDVFIFTDFDSSPAFATNNNNNEFIAIYANDRTSFINEHIGHRVIELEINRNATVCDGFFGDPFAPIYLQAKDSVNFYVIKKWRKDADGPLKFSVAGEFLNNKVLNILPQSNLLKNDLISEIVSLSEKDAEAIVSAFENSAKKFRYSDFSQTLPDETQHTIEYAVPGEKIIINFLDCAVSVLGEERRTEFKSFVSRHIEAYDSLNFIVQKKLSISRRRSGNRMIKFSSKDELINLSNIS